MSPDPPVRRFSGAGTEQRLWIVVVPLLIALVLSNVIIIVLVLERNSNDEQYAASPLPTTTAEPDVAIDPAPGPYVTPEDIGSTVGPASEPTEVYNGPTTITTAGTVLDSVSVEGCLVVEADDVTIRNSVIECINYQPLEATGVSGLVVERNRLVCVAEPWKAILLIDTQFSVVGNESENCEDHVYLDGSIGESRIANNVFWRTQIVPGAHADGVQMGSTGDLHGSIVIEGNWFEANGDVDGYTAAIFLSEGDAEIVVRNNWIDGSYGYFPVRCYSDARCLVEGNTVGPLLEAFTLVASTQPVVARCNRFNDGSPVPDNEFAIEGAGRVVFEPC